ncbi:hypothetical protein [Candidatus Protochlamydia amoebophila]|uniref:hypothetical protein n=1 Tax=Candidatus Protochlamydia amoebophila TaxID=362787 RepID=UPI001E3E05D0|nr:hypothetical protein [Candidatus Protochlamydia amoebophila]
MQKFSEKQLKSCDEEFSNLNLCLPDPNLFIPKQTAFTNLSKEENFPSLFIPQPSVLINDDNGKVYFYKDLYFRLPEIVWSFQIQSSLINKGNFTTLACTDLYIKYLK